MRNLADIKRRAQVGVQLEVIFHGSMMGSTAPIPRTITAVHATKISMTPWAGRTRDSWLTWPAASDIRIDGPDTFTVLEDGEPVLTYRFV
jgi:hypothetical protein